MARSTRWHGPTCGEHVAFGVTWWMAFVSLAGRIRAVISRPRVRRAFDRVTGVFFVALGIRIVTTRPS